MAHIGAKIGEALAAGTAFFYGCLYLTAALIYSVQQKEFWSSSSDEQKARIAKESRELWSLSETTNSLSHHFVRLPDGKQLHYLAPVQSPKDPQNLVVFIHGFPDSGHLFTRQLRSSLSSRNKLVALDLPGCGGSDDFEKYGPNEVLNAIASAIQQLKKRYLGTSKRRCILMGHDWGGVVAFRIAAETEGLVDHIVTMNSLYPAYAEETLKEYLARGFVSLKEGRFPEAREALSPVWSQIRKSGYTYMLTLPLPIAKTEALSAAAKRLSMAYGPGRDDCKTSTPDGQTYGSSVLARSFTNPPGDWDQKVRLYSEGLLREPWTPSSQVGEGIDRSDTAAQQFKYPVNIIFGLKDVALDPRVVLDGIEKYFKKDEHDVVADATHARDRIVRLPDCGHWSILEEEGVVALDKVLREVVGEQV
ncbi:hypothetical protein PRZ48_006830 [Zasmidium cellare]|uniref:AB hydrolase-1 domain-containing protein n=1 Tax=Zasmidium cellare TaxID=395010 RepID=A0ABR0EHR5_ZASCE|nr:hypothetical protein PRZ48_006830 [Zasmidium cellare]